MAPPLTLESANRIIADIVKSQVVLKDPEQLDVKIAAFNQTMWHATVTEDRKFLVISVSVRCWDTLKANGSQEYLKKIYGSLLAATAEEGYDVSIRIPVGEGHVRSPEDAKKISFLASRLYRHMMAGVFHAAFDRALQRGSPDGDIIELEYRPQERIWLRKQNDRVIVIFSIFFEDKDDMVMGRVFLSEMGRLVSGAPAVDVYLKPSPPPQELAHIPGLAADGFVSFLLEARHLAPSQREKTIDTLMQFRNYVHYHLKCCKAYLHIRMRNRVGLLMQVLNRAKQEIEKPAQ